MRSPLVLLSLTLATALVVSMPAMAQMTAADIAGIQEQIDAQGLGWRAGETSMTRLTEDEFRSRLIPIDEYRRMVEEARQLRASRAPVTQLLPAPEDEIFNWHDVGGDDWNSPVKDQGQCGSCTIFAGVGAIEAAINIAGDDPEIDWDVSEQNLLSCTGVTCESGGMSPAAAFTWAVNRGVPDDLCAEYEAINGDCDDACEDIEDRSLVIADWDFVGNGAMGIPTVEQIKAAVSTYGPVGTSMTVFGDLMAYTGGVYEPSDDAQEAGGHSVVIVGWNDDNESWYIKNSWGIYWGEDGYFEIKRGTCGIGEATTSWVSVDPLSVPGSFVLNEDGIEASIQKDEPTVEEVTVTLHRSAGDGDIPFKVVIPESAPWLSVDVTDGTVGADDVDLTFTFDIAGWSEGDEINQEATVEILGSPGLARGLTATFHVTNYNDPNGTDDAGTDDESSSGSDSGSCSVGNVAGTPIGLFEALLRALL